MKRFILLLIVILMLIVASCSISYVHQQDIHHSKIDVESSHEQENDISPPSVSKGIIGGIKAISGLSKILPSEKRGAPAAHVPHPPAAPPDDAERARLAAL